jgi:para-aminobenzoate synthetase/4-amino-4-deoxychorismate lyase
MHPMPAAPASMPRVQLARQPIQAPLNLLRHKTTRREHFAPFDPEQPGVFDCLLWNAAKEVTEFTRGSVVVERENGQRVTPALRCGLLDGVGRALAIASGHVAEDVILVDDLIPARRLWFVNALRGWLEVRLDRKALAGSPQPDASGVSVARAPRSAP